MADEVGWEKVQVPEDEEILIPDAPLVANDPANQRVRLVERSPPPAKAAPAVIVVPEEKR